MICKRCGCEFDNKKVQKKFIDKNKLKYELCCYCRKFRLCDNCGKEFNHHQNITCSKICSEELKEKSFLKSCGTKHNFCKQSLSRIEWEEKLFNTEGIINVFQRDEIKEKSKNTILEKYGVDNVSKLDFIKDKKYKTYKDTESKNPNKRRDDWHLLHKMFIEKLGYDPRLHIFGRASKESLIVFNPLIDWCLNNGILSDDIYIGDGDKKEYFIYSDKKIYFYDFTIKSKKIIIEYNGVFFHAKPSSINWYNPFVTESKEENIEKQELKKLAAYNKGFKILEIWSDENALNNLELCKKFIILNK